ncbi:uncharacterized protein ASCRUDRAFT_74926 [Ascoidea rubescens DSM 1968]|uniref:Uncharacterized protein n=1 Tax=Ascoidea rubescens DSM 1968 TaxID=1344418 RepID=A0A1D2VLS8_9ASCO|nr:hypothetical protein ASCRUDRAFT_74926 [Ascoidea rubescens DSM 1968]ODV62570.1 hypothetical protein ASCRUDRAFT_74926 [Ascoidea rubescens DSM 1968]
MVLQDIDSKNLVQWHEEIVYELYDKEVLHFDWYIDINNKIRGYIGHENREHEETSVYFMFEIKIALANLLKEHGCQDTYKAFERANLTIKKQYLPNHYILPDLAIARNNDPRFVVEVGNTVDYETTLQKLFTLFNSAKNLMSTGIFVQLDPVIIEPSYFQGFDIYVERWGYYHNKYKDSYPQFMHPITGAKSLVTKETSKTKIVMLEHCLLMTGYRIPAHDNNKTLRFTLGSLLGEVPDTFNEDCESELSINDSISIDLAPLVKKLEEYVDAGLINPNTFQLDNEKKPKWFDWEPLM